MEIDEWPQVVIEFADRPTAEQVAVQHLRPELAAAQTDDAITRWWFIRKTPYWRLRYLPVDDHVHRRLACVLDDLAAEGRIIGWTTGIYEPEVHAFGGTAGMDIAHELFDSDSRRILDHLARQQTTGTDTPGLGRRELGLLLYSALMRGAEQDWYEQGDVWAKVARLRPAGPVGVSAEHSKSLRTAAHRLMTVDVRRSRATADSGPSAATDGWVASFEQAGQRLAELTRRGELQRGLRAVLTHHVIFGWNRLGLSYREQHILATLAKEIVMEDSDGAVSIPAASGDRTSLGEVDTDTTEAATVERLRHRLVDRLRAQGTVRTERVAAALRAVPRHLFVPEVPLDAAYADDPVYTKHDGAGVSISAASQPTIVAMMLEQLQVDPCRRVLEIGAGTGYNASLLAHLAGEGGQVTTIDVDDDIVAGARSGLASAGYHNAYVICGDGALGHPDGAPYDRIIATVGAWDLPPAWLEQLAPGGRLVVPLRLRGSVSRSIVFERGNGHWRSRSSQMCTFMPLRGGIADDPRRMISLTPDGSVTLQTDQEQTVDAEVLTGVFDRPRSREWTEVRFRGSESFEWLDLWLTCVMPGALSRMSVQSTAIESGLVAPHFGWGAMATVDQGDLAYLTLRPTENTDGDRLYEVGAIGHGVGGAELASRLAEAIRDWDRQARLQTAHFEIHPTDTREPVTGSPGRFVFDRPRTRLVISWR